MTEQQREKNAVKIKNLNPLVREFVQQLTVAEVYLLDDLQITDPNFDKYLDIAINKLLYEVGRYKNIKSNETILNIKNKTMSVKAKFKCNSITDFGQVKEAHLTAVYSDKGENADFTKYTPSGDLKIATNKEAAASEFFIPGKSYYLTFDEAPE